MPYGLEVLRLRRRCFWVGVSLVSFGLLVENTGRELGGGREEMGESWKVDCEEAR